MKDLVIVRGAGDLASGIIHRLFKAGFHVIVTEVAKPTSIRRKVSFSEAMYFGSCFVEDVEAVKCITGDCINHPDKVIVVADPELKILEKVKPLAIVDATIAKRNLGTYKHMAPIVIGVGPGFKAPDDVHAVIETNRGHDLGRIIYDGTPEKNTGVPGVVGGHDADRVFHAPVEGDFKPLCKIGDIIEEGNPVLQVGDVVMNAPFSGVIRGILPEGFYCPKGMKIADIDPRFSEVKNCYTISDKARNIGGSVLEAILYMKGQLNNE